MSWLGKIGGAIVGVGAGVALVTALPVLGAAGAITATGTAVGSAGGALAGWMDN